MKKLFAGLWSLFLCGAIQAQEPLCTVGGTAPASPYIFITYSK